MVKKYTTEFLMFNLISKYFNVNPYLSTQIACNLEKLNKYKTVKFTIVEFTTLRLGSQDI